MYSLYNVIFLETCFSLPNHSVWFGHLLVPCRLKIQDTDSFNLTQPVKQAWWNAYSNRVLWPLGALPQASSVLYCTFWDYHADAIKDITPRWQIKPNQF